MTNPANAAKMKYLILFTGLLGAMLRWALYLTGTDGKNLLVSGHWAHYAIWILTAGVILLLAFTCFGIKTGENMRSRTAPVGSLGCFLAAAAFVRISLRDFSAAGSNLETAASLLGFGAALSLGWVGVCRLRRTRPIFLCHGLVCLAFALRMVCQYRIWSSDPQLQDYCFIMLAHVGLMLTSYYLAEFDAGMGRHRPTWFLGLLAAYLSLLCLKGSEPLFMLCCGLWVLTNLPLLPRRRPAAIAKETNS